MEFMKINHLLKKLNILVLVACIGFLPTMSVQAENETESATGGVIDIVEKPADKAPLSDDAKEYFFLCEEENQAIDYCQQLHGEFLNYAYGVCRVKLTDEWANSYLAKALCVEFDEKIELEAIKDPVKVVGSEKQWHLDKLNLGQAWAYTKGKGATVAVIDTGVDVDHYEFKKCLKEAVTVIPEEEYNGIKYNPYYKGPKDYVGHGTHVIGIIAARNDKKGVVGIAPDCKIISIKALENGGGSFSNVVRGINCAIEKKVNVINMSLGSKGLEDENLKTAIKNAIDNNITVVCAAGNKSYEIPSYPAAYDEAIAVSAVYLKDDGEMKFDNVFSKSNYGAYIDIAAPGGEIYSTYLDGGFDTLHGTSMACPMVSGSIALLYAMDKDMTVAKAKELLYEYAVDMGLPGWDKYYGNGILDTGTMVSQYGQTLPEPEPAKTSIVVAPVEDTQESQEDLVVQAAANPFLTVPMQAVSNKKKAKSDKEESAVTNDENSTGEADVENELEDELSGASEFVTDADLDVETEDKNNEINGVEPRRTSMMSFSMKLGLIIMCLLVAIVGLLVSQRRKR